MVLIPSLRNLALAAAAAAVMSPAVAPAQTASAAQAAARFPRIYSGPAVKPAMLPVGARLKEPVTVVVQMTGDSIAAARARAPEHHISEAEHQRIADADDNEQAAVMPGIEASGGRILASFHGALNGIKVRIDRDQVESLKSLPGVTAVLPVRTYHLDNTESVPFIGAPQAWQGVPGFQGEGVKVAIIDTGIDYTHADFGGPGTAAAYQAAHANQAGTPDPSLFGPTAPKVKGGWDFAGDAYNANDPTSVPQPDPNPIDCNGHGSHTAGTLAGFGVTEAGATYTGPYDAAAYAQGFLVGPGVAPKADLYSLKVFGCQGSTNLVVDAIDWAIDHNMNVISMSLGADFGTAADADEIAAQNAAKAGIIVVAASGNSGAIPYITSSPAGADTAISVAAMDSHVSFPGASVVLNTGKVELQDSNGAPISLAGVPVVVLLDATQPNGVSLGCDPANYTDAGGNSIVGGKVVVTQRGTCARIARAQLGQKYGAVGVVMINTSGGYPPYEGPIPGVSIPFFGARSTDAATLAAATSAASFTANSISNPTFRTAASFTSQGPRFGDSLLKPNVTAPGVSIFSAAMGSGNGGLFESGTSMATPHVAGVAALARQAHPDWHEADVSAAVVETADPTGLTDYTPSIEGAGLVQAPGAVNTQAVVFADTAGGAHAISFGFDEFLRRFDSERRLVIVNHGSRPIVFNVTTTPTSAVQHTVEVDQNSVTVPAHGTASLEVSLQFPASAVGGTHDAYGNPVFDAVSGYVSFTPADPSMNDGVTLHMPYFLVPRARSDVRAFLTDRTDEGQSDPHAELINAGGGITGVADFYQWGLASPPQGLLKYFDTRAVGVQSISTSDPANPLLVFAINTYTRFSTPEVAEFDVLIDVNGDGKPDFDVVGVDLGDLLTGTFSGQYASVIVDLKTNTAFDAYLADAPTDGSTVLLPVSARDLGLTGSTVITYTETTTSFLTGVSETLPGSASFDPYNPAVSSGFAVAVAPHSHVSVPVSINAAELAKTPARGFMVVVEDNHSGASQAGLMPVSEGDIGLGDANDSHDRQGDHGGGGH